MNFFCVSGQIVLLALTSVARCQCSLVQSCAAGDAEPTSLLQLSAEVQAPAEQLTLTQIWPYLPVKPDTSKGYGVVGCLQDPFASFEAAISCMLACMAGVALLCWAMTAPASTTTGVATSDSATGAGANGAKRQVQPCCRPRMSALDGMRTVLTTYIIIYHWVTAGTRPLIMPEFVRVATQAAHLVVTMFFVLSGFVGFVSESEKREYFTAKATQSFIVRRLVRLCPAYFAALIWLAVLASRDQWNKQPFIAWPLQAIFGQTLFPLTFCGSAGLSEKSFFLPFSANYVSWFISALVLVTLCWPLMYNSRPRSGFHCTALVFLLVVFVRSVPTILEVVGVFPCPGVTLMNFGHCKSLYVFAPMRAFEYYAGALAGQLSDELPQAAKDWGGWSHLFDGSMVIAIMLGVVFNLQGPPERVGEYFNTALFSVTCIACRMHYAQVANNPKLDPNPGVFGRLLSSQIFVLSADYSYGAYIYSLAVLASRPELPENLFIVPIIGNWLVAAASLKFFENPISNFMQRRMRRSK